MASFSRREFVKAAAALPALSGTSQSANPKKLAVTTTRGLQPYGTANDRSSFTNIWSDWQTNPFEHQEFPAFHRLTTSLDALYSRCQQPVSTLDDRPVFLQVKILCSGEAGRTLFTLGIKSENLGTWAFSLGACPTQGISFGITGWNLLVNAAAPWEERVPIAGLDHRDWHTFVLKISNAEGPAQVYCDGQHVLDLQQPITAAQRKKNAANQNNRHGSIQQLVPETPGQKDYVFIESRHPGQIIDIDHFKISQEPMATRRRSLPVLLDLDWELNGTQKVEYTLTRFEDQPVLNEADVPDPSDRHSGASAVSVVRDEQGFHMYFMGVNEFSQDIGRTTFGIYRAFSRNGTDWKVDPKTPVLEPGEPGSWDAGCLGQMAVRKEHGRFRMWYGGYAFRLQQGRAGYAESPDGIHWKKPDLGVAQFAGRPGNICFSLQPGPNCNEYQLPLNIVRDEAAPSDRRYVLFLHTQGPHGFIVDVATSPDGLRFVRAPHNARHYAFDTTPRNSTLHGAAVVLHESDYWWAFVGHHEAEDRGYRMRFTGWVVEPEEKENISFGLWNSRRTHLAPNPQSWDRESVNIGSFLEVGNEWWIYYDCEGGVGLAKVGRHRMYGVQLNPETQTGEVTSIGLDPPREGWRPYQLVVNVSGLSKGGRLTAQLVSASDNQPIEGFTTAEAVPIEKDGYDIPLEWTTHRTHLPDLESPLRVRFELTRGLDTPRLHAIYLRKHAS
ncbi:MAG: hypothetical protein MK110_10635 [Fuerstiella sp.]|nr:hypothetical protein [Fuerstiella sp.]